jgi:hypothetical protein
MIDLNKKAIVEGQVVRIGDVVSFKSDIEQSGTIVDIKKTYMGTSLVLQSDYGFEGGYIGGETIHTELANDCWLD